MGHSRNCWNGTTSALQPEGTRISCLPIRKKSGNLFNDPRTFFSFFYNSFYFSTIIFRKLSGLNVIDFSYFRIFFFFFTLNSFLSGFLHILIFFFFSSKFLNTDSLAMCISSDDLKWMDFTFAFWFQLITTEPGSRIKASLWNLK